MIYHAHKFLSENGQKESTNFPFGTLSQGQNFQKALSPLKPEETNKSAILCAEDPKNYRWNKS